MRTRFFAAALALVFGAGLFLAAPSNQASANYGNVHCVRHGETLSGIAAAYGTSVWAIANANGIANPNYIRAGMCLTIPSGGGYYGGGYYGGYNGGYNSGYYAPKVTPYYGNYYGGYDYYKKQMPYYGGYYGGYNNYWYGKKW